MTGITALQAQSDARAAGDCSDRASVRGHTPPRDASIESTAPRRHVDGCLNFCDVPPAPAAESLAVVGMRCRLFRGNEQLIRT
jgi:hypothetical protein